MENETKVAETKDYTVEAAGTVEPAAQSVDTEKAEVAELEKAQARIAELEKARVEAESARVEAEKALASERRVAKVRAKKDHVIAKMKAVPGDVDELAERLVALSELDSDLASFVESILEKASGTIEAGALSQEATTEKADDPADLMSRFERLVAKKLADNPGMARAAAQAAVWRENPEMYAEYEKDKSEAR